jgi:hypothetical protein
MARFDEPINNEVHKPGHDTAVQLSRHVENIHRDVPHETAKHGDLTSPHKEEQLTRSVSLASISEKIESLMRGTPENQERMRHVLEQMLA